MIYVDYSLMVQPELMEPDAPIFMGCEFEIEDCHSIGDLEGRLKIAEDGSLRNNGHEFITPPTEVSKMLPLFEFLHSRLMLGNSPYSERTSIHVHVNCCNLTQSQVRDVVLYYALFEEAFFSICDPSRRDNIHCVALTETALPSWYGTSLGNLLNRWHKYTALNLKPIATQGTIEFRHMHGHNDPVLLGEWLTILEQLVLLGRSTKITSQSFSEESLEAVFNQLFGKSRIAGHWKYLRPVMENQIIDVKLSLG